jgi:uncharacterized surface protein with fasciclin (FAS1) repeats
MKGAIRSRVIFIVLLLSCSAFFQGCVEKISVPEAADASIWQILLQLPEHSTLVSALERTGLREPLATQGPFTLFAPDNAAFSRYLANQLNNNINMIPLADLRNLLLFHLVPGRLLSKNMQSGSLITFLPNQRLNVDVSRSGVLLDRGSTVVEADLDGINGTIHLIDTILTPQPAN